MGAAERRPARIRSSSREGHEAITLREGRQAERSEPRPSKNYNGCFGVMPVDFVIGYLLQTKVPKFPPNRYHLKVPERNSTLRNLHSVEIRLSLSDLCQRKLHCLLSPTASSPVFPTPAGVHACFIRRHALHCLCTFAFVFPSAFPDPSS